MSAAVTPPNERDSDSLTPGQVVGRYEIVRRLAVGGMAEIFLARATGPHGFEKQVVIKRILPHHTFNRDFVSMFLDEARIAATLHHPNIAQVYDIGEDSVSFFFAMEYVEGKDLRDILKANRRARTAVPLKFAVSMVLGAAAGLHAAHEKRDPQGRLLNIVHRDASPSNILLGFDGSVKLIDFGIVKADGRQTATRTGIVKGKYAYMSPEQCRGDQLDRRSDIFTLGIVLFELTTGRRLFATNNEYQTMRKILKDPLPRPTELVRGYPPELERIVLRALSRNREERYQTMQELFNDLQVFAARYRLMVSQYDLAAYMGLMFPEDAPSDVTVRRPESSSDPLSEKRTLVGVGAPYEESDPSSVPRRRVARGSSPTGHRLSAAQDAAGESSPPLSLVPKGRGRRYGHRFSTQEPTIDLGSERSTERIAEAGIESRPKARPTVPIKKVKHGARDISPTGSLPPAVLVDTGEDRSASPELEALLDSGGALGSASKQELASMLADLDAAATHPADVAAPVIRKLTAGGVRVPQTVASFDDEESTWATPLRIALIAALVGLITVGGWVLASSDWSSSTNPALDADSDAPLAPEALRPLESGVYEPAAAPDVSVAADEEPADGAQVEIAPTEAAVDTDERDEEERRARRRRAQRRAARAAAAEAAVEASEPAVEIFDDDSSAVGEPF